jgi:hypothetical protein
VAQAPSSTEQAANSAAMAARRPNRMIKPVSACGMEPVTLTEAIEYYGLFMRQTVFRANENLVPRG